MRARAGQSQVGETSGKSSFTLLGADDLSLAPVEAFLAHLDHLSYKPPRKPPPRPGPAPRQQAVQERPLRSARLHPDRLVTARHVRRPRDHVASRTTRRSHLGGLDRNRLTPHLSAALPRRGCGYGRQSQGLCARHAKRWRREGCAPAAAEWAVLAEPVAKRNPRTTCLISRCTVWRPSHGRRRCSSPR